MYTMLGGNRTKRFVNLTARDISVGFTLNYTRRTANFTSWSVAEKP